MIKLLRKNSLNLEILSISELEKLMDFQWTDQLIFQTPEIDRLVRKRTMRSLRKKEITIKEKWLGVNFRQEIERKACPNVSLRYIDAHLGFGVFAEEEIPSRTFIGEYTGMVRKRLGRPDRSNDYTFEYAIGQWLRNPLIIDAKRVGNLTRFINHNSRPNLESVSVYANGVMHIILISIQPIPKGAQLFYDYGDIFWKKRQKVLMDF